MVKNEKRVVWRYTFALVVIVFGVLFKYFDVGRVFLGFSSVGAWLIYIGFVMLAIISLQLISNRKRIVDERMESLAFKASRMTFLFVVFAAFVVMVIDGVREIIVSYSLFMSYLIAYMMLVYFVVYKILEKYY